MTCPSYGSTINAIIPGNLLEERTLTNQPEYREKLGPLESQVNKDMQYTMFVVDETPYCFWGWDLQEKNIAFLNYINPKYFEYIAQVHFENLETDNKYNAAISLRTSYFHGIETLFTLLCAALQSPHCVFGWIQKCKSEQLRNMVKKINLYDKNVFNKIGLEDVTWETISNNINLFAYDSIERLQETRESFAHLWQRFAHDFLNDKNIKEYNSIKHGFRMKPGGFSIMVGEEKEYCIAVPEEDMKLIGGSEFGTSFFIVEKVRGLENEKNSPHFFPKLHSINWNPMSLSHSLNLISISINNIISFLKIINGVDPKSVQFTRPQDKEYFKEPWKRPVGIVSFSLDHEIYKEQIHKFTKKEIFDGLKIKTTK